MMGPMICRKIEPLNEDQKWSLKITDWLVLHDIALDGFLGETPDRRTLNK